MAAEPEVLHSDVLVEDEPRYLRRQKPVEIRRRKFGKSAWLVYARNFLIFAAVFALGLSTYVTWRYLMYSPRFVLADVNGIEVVGNRYVARELVLEKFAADSGHSVLRVPLTERRSAVESISWVERAAVQRILPNRLQVVITERTPVAFLRLGSELALIDASGVILEKPIAGEFAFPVITGITDAMAVADRSRRMKLFTL
ncbi:MAG: FtsQ-type POTRA domain-containing protein, partial [Acidobacteria bacterium]|nr:FtsQ-type POTRA domain-containing protein [Acidobacteriota bacterium]